jgi:predicted peroxiredoxin
MSSDKWFSATARITLGMNQGPSRKRRIVMNAAQYDIARSTHRSQPVQSEGAGGTEYLFVLLTSGREDGGKRATLAFSMACTALAMEAEAALFLIGDGADWAYEGRAEDVHVRGFPPLEELMNQYVELGGRLMLCSACDAVCSLPVDERGMPLRRREGVHLSGIASSLELMQRGKAVTF